VIAVRRSAQYGTRPADSTRRPGD